MEGGGNNLIPSQYGKPWFHRASRSMKTWKINKRQPLVIINKKERWDRKLCDWNKGVAEEFTKKMPNYDQNWDTFTSSQILMFEIYDLFWITLWLTNEGLNYKPFQLLHHFCFNWYTFFRQVKLHWSRELAKKSGLDQSELGNPWSQID